MQLPIESLGFAYVGEDAQVFDSHLSIFLKPENIRIGQRARLDGMIKIEGGNGVVIGDGCHISTMSHINAGGGTVLMGRGSGCASHTIICGGMTDMAMLATTPQDGNVAKRRVTTIGEHVLIFAGAIICPGVTLNDKCVVAAGAVVTRDVPRRAIVAGVPGKIVGYRSITKEAGA